MPTEYETVLHWKNDKACGCSSSRFYSRYNLQVEGKSTGAKEGKKKKRNVPHTNVLDARVSERKVRKVLAGLYLGRYARFEM
jgi:hypothetical protein